jgi:hypothetical protein
LSERTSHKLYEREKGKFKQGQNVLLRELFKETDALFAVKITFALKCQKQEGACAKNSLELF